MDEEDGTHVHLLSFLYFFIL